jgi:hypothetical protein
MNIRKPKTLEDFPKFEVAKVRRGETSRTGYTKFELEGRFDRAMELPADGPQWFWLLMRQNDCLCVTRKSLNDQTGLAVVTCDEKRAPDVVGQTLFYLGPAWNAFDVWMVLDPKWGWARTQVEGIDAVATDYEWHEVSIVDGHEIRVWTKLEAAGGASPITRYYPAENQTSPPDTTPRVIKGGWGHENCTLCREHIDVGGFGYRDPDRRWICEKCHERYVVPQDLSFVDEL